MKSCIGCVVAAFFVGKAFKVFWENQRKPDGMSLAGTTKQTDDRACLLLGGLGAAWLVFKR